MSQSGLDYNPAVLPASHLRGSAAVLLSLRGVTNLQATRYELKKDGQDTSGINYVAALNAVKRKFPMACERHFPPPVQEALQTQVDAVRSEGAADRVVSADTSHLAGTSGVGGGLAMVHTTENLGNVSFIHRFSMTLTPLIPHLNRFAITGDDSLYALHNAGGELSLYDPQTDQGSLTRDYLNDRAAFVLAQINLDLNGTQTHAPEAIEYHDLTRAVVITETTTNSADITRRIVFGSEGNDVLDQGGRLADHLYGGKGRDRLSGGDGDDYLEGGQGSDWMDGGIGTDTYFYKPGDGEDTLSDSDGLGVLHIGGHTIAGAGTAHASLEQGTATWVDDAGFRYQLTRNGDLTITGGTLLTDDKVTIKHFDIAQGTLGIQLNNAMLIGIVSCSASNPFKAPDTPAIGVGTDVNNALSIGIASSGASNPFRVPDVPAIGVETDVNEGGAAGLKVVFNRPALSGERLVIGVAGDDAATLSLLSGHGAQMLPDGGLEFLLQPGQTEIRFVVSSIADIAADTRYTLAATVYPADTNEVAATSSHLLTIHDGTYAVLPGSISHSMYGTSGADALHDTNANDSIETGAGDDEVAKHFAGNDQVVLGDGDDLIVTVGGDWIWRDRFVPDQVDECYDSTGNDLIQSGIGDDVVKAWLGRDQICADARYV